MHDMLDDENTDARGKLGVIWSSADPEVALNLVFMYTKNAKLQDWWARVRLVVWGPSARVLCENPELQAELEEVRAAGVETWACKACADNYGLAARLEELGVKVLYMGQPLTTMLQKEGWHVLTF